MGLTGGIYFVTFLFTETLASGIAGEKPEKVIALDMHRNSLTDTDRQN